MTSKSAEGAALLVSHWSKRKHIKKIKHALKYFVTGNKAFLACISFLQEQSTAKPSVRIIGGFPALSKTD